MAKEALSPEEAAARPARRRSGFADPAYWEAVMPSGLTRREEQRQKALQMHQEPHPDDPTRRRFGGAQPNSGPPRVKRMHEVLAETAIEEAEQAARALKSMLRHKSPMVQLQAIRQLLEIEAKNDADMREDERELRRMRETQLDQEFKETMVALGVKVRDGQEPPIDGEAEVISDPELTSGEYEDEGEDDAED